MLRQAQTQKLLQKLSPQQIQLMKLLQVPTANLEERIKDELESNPALDINVDYNTGEKYDQNDNQQEDIYGDTNNYEDSNDYGNNNDLDLSSYLQSDNTSNNDYNYYNDEDDKGDTNPIKVETSFHDYLADQLNLIKLTEEQKVIAEQVIGSIDDDGYLRRDPISITDDLAFKHNFITTGVAVEEVIKIVQNFDPPGVGASDLQECLLLQLKKTPTTKAVQHAIVILSNYFEEFTKKHYDKIKTRLKLNESDFKAAIQVIIKLTPKPGLAFASTYANNNYIIPDFFITNNNGKLELTLNARNAPDLRISEGYREMFQSYANNKDKNKRNNEAVLFIKQKIDAAKWFIDAIKQRQHTLLITMNAIMSYQYDFFLSGDESNLKPMILKDIADVTNMDISTISRVANSKYVQTEYGTYLLKFFFSEAMVSDSGEEVSTREVKNILLNLVQQENKKKPYSDEKLMELLSNEGYSIARRTIAKYREQLDIPVARLRKEA